MSASTDRVHIDLDTPAAARPGPAHLQVRIDGATVYPGPSARDVLHLALETAGYAGVDLDLAGGCWAVAVAWARGGEPGEVWISDADARIDYPLAEHTGWTATWNPGGYEGAMAGDSTTLYESQSTDIIADTRQVITALRELDRDA